MISIWKQEPTKRPPVSQHEYGPAFRARAHIGDESLRLPKFGDGSPMAAARPALAIGQSNEFFELLADLAHDADNASRGD